MKSFTDKLAERIKIYLSHHPAFYALVVGIGVVLFWRGVWHSIDLIHMYFDVFQNNLTIDAISSPWWDGPLSFLVGIIMLYFTGAFTSSFIGNELILSGLRKEKKLSEKTESEVRTEEQVIVDIKQELEVIADKIGELEKEVHNKKHLK